MGDGRREIYGKGVGPENGEGQGGFDDGKETEGDRAESGSNPVGDEAGKGFIYFIETEDGQFVKIGFSINVVRRMSQLGTIMPVRLLGCFPGTTKMERWLHVKFAANRAMGEWFRPSDELRQFIAINVESPAKEPERQAAPCLPKNAAAMEMVRQRLKKLSPERRKEIAKKAAAARWGKKKTS